MPGRDVTQVLVGFARVLRGAGVAATPGRVQAMLTAVDLLGTPDRQAVYWAGRLTLCAVSEDLPRYERAFTAYFAGEPPGGPAAGPPPGVGARPVAVPAAASARTGADGDRRPERVATASAAEVLRRRDLARLDAAERAEVRRLIAALDPYGDLRRSRRRAPSHRGALDARRTVRALLRGGGEPVRLLRHAPTQRPRRLVLLLDVSASMAGYADAYLRFAHAAARRRPGTEVFTLGTRLTRISREVRLGDPDAALAAVGAAVADWSGGTRLGELLRAFLDRWGQRGTARGAVVVVFSDGWERGDATLLGAQMQRLHRLAARVVWVNPHRGKPGYAPATAGMAAALPHVDQFVAGHTVAALQELSATLSTPARGGNGA